MTLIKSLEENSANQIDKKGVKAKVEKYLLIVSGVLILAYASYFVYFLIFLNKTYPNIFVNEIAVGGKSKQEIMEDLKKAQKPQIELFYKEKQYQINPDSFNLKIDTDETSESVFKVGKNEDLISNAKKQIELFSGEKEVIGLEIEYDKKLLEEEIASISAEIDEEIILPEVYLTENNEASVSAYKDGKKVNQEDLLNIIINSYRRQEFGKKEIPVEKVSENITAEQIEYMKNFATNLIGKELELAFEENLWSIPDNELVNFLSINRTVDDIKLTKWLKDFSVSVDREPQNALFEFDGAKVSEFKPAKNGVRLVLAQNLKKIRNGISNLAKSEEQIYKIDLVVEETEPKIKNGMVNDMGIKEIIGVGESWFSHSIASRVRNIEVASAKMHGVLVPPNEEFSLINTVGPVDANHGYEEAYVIVNGRTELGQGGGVCQTSTTMFRAALDAGVEILERAPHAYRVSYYEQNYELGVDASVYEPKPDLRFKNDTGNYILIQTFVDTVNMYARYELYGTSDGRVSEISKSTTWSQSPPPPDIYQDDPTLPVGTVKQTEHSIWGAKVSFDWKVTRNGETLHEETFWSNYKAWPAVYLKGTKQ